MNTRFPPYNVIFRPSNIQNKSILFLEYQKMFLGNKALWPEHKADYLTAICGLTD
jgi:hypothetical protein